MGHREKRIRALSEVAEVRGKKKTTVICKQPLSAIVLRQALIVLSIMLIYQGIGDLLSAIPKL